MTLEEKFYQAIDDFCGGRENHTPILVKQLMEITARQVAAERERIKEVIIKSKNEHYQDFLDDTTDKHAYGKYRACENILELIDSL